MNKCLISDSDSAWSSPVLLVKKLDVSYWMCLDYRAVNPLNEPDAYLLPRRDDSLNVLDVNIYNRPRDLVAGYWQLEKSKDLTAFCTSFGPYHWKIWSLGLTAVPSGLRG